MCMPDGACMNIDIYYGKCLGLEGVEPNVVVNGVL